MQTHSLETDPSPGQIAEASIFDGGPSAGTAHWCNDRLEEVYGVQRAPYLLVRFGESRPAGRVISSANATGLDW
eukprot:6931772-Pyramimonas_sp.AAC.1